MENKKNKILWAIDPFETESKIIKIGGSALKPFSPIPVEPVYVASPAQTRLNLEFSVPVKQRYKVLALEALKKVLRPVRTTSLLPPKVLVENHLTISAGAKTLAAYASREKALMIVVGTRAKKGISRTLMGSFAENLLLHSKVPVLLVNPHGKPSPAIHKILFATDFSPPSRRALDRILPLARALRAELLIHHVLCKPFPMTLWTGDIFLEQTLVPMGEFLRWETQQARRLGDGFIRLAEKKKVRAKFLLEISAKGVAETILNRARAAKVSLIAMASQGTRFETLLLGSASRGVLRESTKPVWILRS